MFRSFLFVTFCFFSLLHPSFTQEWVRQHPFPALTHLMDITMEEDGHGWAVGNDKVFLYTQNFGQTWQPGLIERKCW